MTILHIGVDLAKNVVAVEGINSKGSQARIFHRRFMTTCGAIHKYR
jgi:hypothetical protein